jgi:N-acetylglutamate synthase-like GNAT family acetyltransferase
MPDLIIRTATLDDAAEIDLLVRRHQVEGHLLPRTESEIRAEAGQFVVCEVEGEIKACAELVALSPRVAEIRSLVVAGDTRRAGVGARLVAELRSRARAAGFESLAAFTHDPRVFMRHNFSIVPHLWVPEKITKDCQSCPLFRTCGQYAMLLPLAELPRYGVPAVLPRRAAVA